MHGRDVSWVLGEILSCWLRHRVVQHRRNIELLIETPSDATLLYFHPKLSQVSERCCEPIVHGWVHGTKYAARTSMRNTLLTSKTFCVEFSWGTFWQKDLSIWLLVPRNIFVKRKKHYTLYIYIYRSWAGRHLKVLMLTPADDVSCSPLTVTHPHIITVRYMPPKVPFSKV